MKKTRQRTRTDLPDPTYGREHIHTLSSYHATMVLVSGCNVVREWANPEVGCLTGKTGVPSHLSRANCKISGKKSPTRPPCSRQLLLLALRTTRSPTKIETCSTP